MRLFLSVILLLRTRRRKVLWSLCGMIMLLM
ncbi:unnamed protein product, partial [Vitis vinifera]